MSQSAKTEYRNHLRAEIARETFAAFQRAKTDKARELIERDRLRRIAVIDAAEREDCRRSGRA